MSYSAYPKLVKSVATRRYAVNLMQNTDGSYYVETKLIFAETETASEDILDLRTAAMLFDLRIQELEGN